MANVVSEAFEEQLQLLDARLAAGMPRLGWKVGRAELVPQHLGDLVLLVAQQLAASGRQLQAGDHILSGCFVAKALRFRQGQTAHAQLADFGAVSCRALQVS